MESKKAIILSLGVLCGMVFVYGLGIMTTRLPARLKYDFFPGKVLRYEVEARIDNLTLIDRSPRKVPARYRYTEKMQLNLYHYHSKTTGARIVMMERLTSEIVPESITVAGEERVAQLGRKFAARTPSPWYMFFSADSSGEISCQRRFVTVADMIVSTYYVRRLRKGRALTRDTWSGALDAGAFRTTYEWRFDRLLPREPGQRVAQISGEGEFLIDAPDGSPAAAGKPVSLGSYTYSYALGVGDRKGYVTTAEGSFDIRVPAAGRGVGISYREEFNQRFRSADPAPWRTQDEMSDQLEALKVVLAQEELGDIAAFHDALYDYLQTYSDSPLWENLLRLLNHLRTARCGEAPLRREDLLGKDDAGLK